MVSTVMAFSATDFDPPQWTGFLVDPRECTRIAGFKLVAQWHRIVIIDDFQCFAGFKQSIIEKIVACREMGGMVRTSITGIVRQVLPTSDCSVAVRLRSMMMTAASSFEPF